MHASVPLQPPAFIQVEDSRKRLTWWTSHFGYAIGLSTTAANLTSEDVQAAPAYSQQEVEAAIDSEGALFQSIRESELDRYLESP